MICLSELIDLHVFQMKQGKKVGKTTGFAARMGGCGIDALTVQTDTGESRLLKLKCVKSVGVFGLTIDQENAFISEQEISDFLQFDMQALRKVITVDENGQFLGTILDMEWLPEQLQMKSFILLDQGEKVKIFYPNISVLGQDMIVLNVRFPNYELEQTNEDSVTPFGKNSEFVVEAEENQNEKGSGSVKPEPVISVSDAKVGDSSSIFAKKVKFVEVKSANDNIDSLKETVKIDFPNPVVEENLSVVDALSVIEKAKCMEKKVDVIASEEKAEEMIDTNQNSESGLDSALPAVEEYEEMTEKPSEKATIVKKNEQNSQSIQSVSFQDFSKPALAIVEEALNASKKEKPLEKELDIPDEDVLESIVETSAQEVTEAVQLEFPELSELEKGILEKQIHILLNRRLINPIFTSSGDLMFKAGTLLTLERILKAQKMSPLLILDCAQNIEF